MPTVRLFATLAAMCLQAAIALAQPGQTDRVATPSGDLEITPWIHSSVQIAFGGKVIQVDPWSVADLERVRPADLILITDDVGHHLDVRAIRQLRKPGAPVIIAANGKAQVPDGIVLPNGQQTVAAGIAVESLAAYDIIPGEPAHPKGQANGYLVTIGGKRILLAGVTECVPEVKDLKNIDVAFMPMNIPPGRMTPSAAASCTKAINPKIVYVYHYDQDWASRATNPNAASRPLPGGLTVPQTLEAFRRELQGTNIDVRIREWYPKP
jgi:L-ascorbate metabolism protein UlaG (beta-lactamase superfamily)